MREKETLQGIITFREANKSKDMTLNGSYMSLLQLLQSLQYKNYCASVAATPPRMVMSTAGVINTSSNEAISENKVENDRVVTRVNPSVPLGRVGNDGRLKGIFVQKLFSI